MALIDDIETYGKAVAAGEMTKQEAITALVEAGGNTLTPTGAADLIANWQAAQGQYEQEHNRAFHSKAAIENGRRPHPSSKANQL